MHIVAEHYILIGQLNVSVYFSGSVLISKKIADEVVEN